MVYIGDIQSNTRRAWSEYFWDLGLAQNDLKNWLSFEEACSYLLILKSTPDKPEIFPHGKWAAIQVLEDQIREHIKTEYLKGEVV